MEFDSNFYILNSDITIKNLLVNPNIRNIAKSYIDLDFENFLIA